MHSINIAGIWTHSSLAFIFFREELLLLLEYHLNQAINSRMPSFSETIGLKLSTLLVSEISAYVLWRSDGGIGSNS